MNSKWFTVSEIEEKTNIPHQTIRRYIKAHGHHMNLKKKHKSYLVNDESIKIITDIRQMYSDGMNSEQVDNQLINRGIPMNLRVEDTHEHVNINVPETLLDMKKSMELLHEKMSEQEKINKMLVQKISEQDEILKKQHEYLENEISNRDAALVSSIKEILESKKAIAAAADLPKKSRKWYQFWLKN
jgi:uncharacterized protein (UPF0210 family)